jgi:hypothetical protein
MLSELSFQVQSTGINFGRVPVARIDVILPQSVRPATMFSIDGYVTQSFNWLSNQEQQCIGQHRTSCRLKASEDPAVGAEIYRTVGVAHVGMRASADGEDFRIHERPEVELIACDSDVPAAVLSLLPNRPTERIGPGYLSPFFQTYSVSAFKASHIVLGADTQMLMSQDLGPVPDQIAQHRVEMISQEVSGMLKQFWREPLSDGDEGASKGRSGVVLRFLLISFAAWTRASQWFAADRFW